MRQRIMLGGAILLFLIIGIWWQSQRRVLAPTPTSNGITPAQSTRADVLALLGEPDETWDCLSPRTRGESRYAVECNHPSDLVHYGYYYEGIPDDLFGWYEIQFNGDDTVNYVVDSRRVAGDLESMSVAEFLTQYGKPEQVVWSWRGGGRRGLLYCEQGFILHAKQPAMKGVWIQEIVYFAPLTTAQCLGTFYNEVVTTDPNAGWRNINWVQDPWGFDEAER